jgi:hypothetical protein
MTAKELQQLGPLQEKWMEELESGNHQQTRRALFDGTGYCCLGIGARFVLGIRPICDKSGRYTFGENGRTGLEKDYKKLGLYTPTGGQYEPRRFHRSLAILNDGIAGGYSASEVCSKTFKDIAAIIRSDPSVYFTEPK